MMIDPKGSPPHDWRSSAQPAPPKSFKIELELPRTCAAIADGHIPDPNGVKDTNPKDIVGATKPVQSTVSRIVINEVRKILGYVPTIILWKVGLGMEEGARKYGRHNYRVSGVRASIYYDATYRHIDKWSLGENIDPDSNLNHIVKAICSLTVLIDAAYNDKFNDDRPPPSKYKWDLLDLHDELDNDGTLVATVELDRVYSYLDAWWEGQDLIYLIKAEAALFRLADSIERDLLLDNRDQNANPAWMTGIQEHMDGLIKLYPNPKPPFTKEKT